VSVPAAWIVIIGMAFVPALYAWFNIVGFWDPYSQTSHIRVAVANEDESRTQVLDAADAFHAKIVDYSRGSIVFRMAGQSRRTELHTACRQDDYL